MSPPDMILDIANMVGLAGSALMVGALAYSNLAQRIDLVLFNLFCLVGAGLLFWSLTIHFNVASMILEIVWVVIALFGLVNALRARRA